MTTSSPGPAAWAATAGSASPRLRSACEPCRATPSRCASPTPTDCDNGCVQIRIVGTDLPGRDCPPGHNFPGYTNVHVGMQTKRRPPELLNLQPGDADEVTWTIDCEVNGSDVRGPYIQ